MTEHHSHSLNGIHGIGSTPHVKHEADTIDIIRCLQMSHGSITQNNIVVATEAIRGFSVLEFVGHQRLDTYNATKSLTNLNLEYSDNISSGKLRLVFEIAVWCTMDSQADSFACTI